MGTTVLLNLVGGIALLLWGLHMVQSGILRAFGADLRRVARHCPAQPVCRASGRHRRHRASAKQYGHRADDSDLPRRWAGRAGPRAGYYAGRQYRHNPDRSGVQLRRIHARPGSARDRCHRLQEQRAHQDSRPRPGRDRPWPDAAVAAYPARHTGAGGIRAQRAGLAHRHDRHADPEPDVRGRRWPGRRIRALPWCCW